jgi:ATP/maltotriose-dependent transcriptional regulator MalT
LQLLDFLIERARRNGDPRLATWLDTSAAALGAVGRWSLTEARSREAFRLAREHGQQNQAASCLTTLAWLAARRGRERECRRLVAEALAIEERSDLVSVWAASATGLLEFGLGDLDAAIATLEGIVSSAAPRIGGDPSWTYAYAHLIEAYAGVGRRRDAIEALRQLEALVRDSPRPSVAAMAARCRGLVAPADEFDRHFKIALEHHRRSVNPFIHAHTELAYGSRLRRARRRADARMHLRAALGTFERLGATPWATRARRELAATRSRSTPTSTDVTELLTPQELAVAALVARGLRNDDVAASLYVTRRAVEYHLTNIYRKLEIDSRTQLTGLLSQH